MSNHSCSLVVATALLAGCGDGKSDVRADGRPDIDELAGRIAAENQQPGTGAWALDDPAMAGEIEGYASHVSAAAGDVVSVMVSMSRAGTFTWHVYRLGYYGGAGGRLIVEGGPVKGDTQADPTFEPDTGLIEASWTPSFTLDTSGWLTGAYVVRLERDDGKQSYVPLIMRDDTRTAEVALQHSTATWAAYNDWGGDSLYVSTHDLVRGRKVSYDRPYVAGLGFGSGLLIGQEASFLRWLEERGYDVEYTTDLDTGGPSAQVDDNWIFVAIGHDEYISMEQRLAYEQALARGVNFAFLTGNTMYWQVRYEDEGRTVVCYKDRVDLDPMVGVDDSRVSTAFRDPPVNLPENQFLGVISQGSAVSEGTDWIVQSSDHWIYAGTGLGNGDRIPGVVGFEWDGLLDNGLAPHGLTVLASSTPLPDRPEEPHNATIYEDHGAFLFAAGSMYFGKLASDEPAVTRMIENVLGKAGADPHTVE